MNVIERYAPISINSNAPSVYLQLCVFHRIGFSDSNKQVQPTIAEYHSDQAHNEHCIATSATIADLKQCLATKKHPSAESYRAKEDLNAQRDMAYWAEAMLKASLAAVLLTGIGVVYIALTLREAKATNRAAWETVKETRRIGEAQTRAYVAVTSCVFDSVDGFATARLTIKNCGQTPAHRVILDFKSGVHETLDMVFLRAGGPDHKLTPKQTLAAGGEVQIDARSDVEHGGTLINKLDAGSHIFVANGLVRYFDVFGRQWEQEFQFATGGRYGYDGKRMVGSKQYMPEKEITYEKPGGVHSHSSLMGEAVTLTVNRRK